MSFKQLIISLSLIWLYCVISEAEETPCLEPEPVKDFEIYNFTGSWYKFAFTKDKIGTSRCLRYMYYKADDSEMFPMIRMWKDKSDNSTHIRLKNATLENSGQGLSLDGDPYTVVGVDYASWAVVLACDEKANKRLVWIITRQPKPDISTISKANDNLSSNNLTQAELNFVDQNDCNGWSNAVLEEQDFKYEDVKEDLNKVGFYNADDDEANEVSNEK